MDDDSSKDDGSPKSSIKIIPRNLTAFAAYPVPGNPVISRPESGVEVSFPGLEIDQRALEQRFFPGLYFEVHREDGVVLADVDLRPSQLASGLSRSDLSPLRPIFLLGMLCKVKPTDEEPQFFSFQRLTAREIGPRIRDLLPGRVAIIFGPSWEAIFEEDFIKRPLQLDRRLKQLEAAFKAVDDADKFIVERDKNGQLLCGIFSDERTNYLNKYGVIDPAIFPPGDLTKTLCAPWIYDFRDCICFYWASNKPDITDGTEPPFLNYLRDRKKPIPPPTADYNEWVKQRIDVAQLVNGAWRSLPIVINDREERRAFRIEHDEELADLHDLFAKLDPDFNRDNIINELQYLATVEHALIVGYLFAHYSLNIPSLPEGQKLDERGEIISSAAADLLEIAIDEMRHFLWVNELLRLLDCDKPVTQRADVIGLPPEKDEDFCRKRLKNFRYLNLPFSLRSLSFEVLDQFIEIEANSRSLGANGKSFGMYVQILASLMQGDSKLANTEHALRIVKLLIDEGDQHGVMFQSMKARLKSIKGEFARDLRNDVDDEPTLNSLNLGDTYYHNLLELIHVSYALKERAGGDLIRDAVKLMYKLDEVGHDLASRNIGLRFTEPKPSQFRVPENMKDALQMLKNSEERLMEQLQLVKATGQEQSKNLAEKQEQSSKQLYQRMRQTIQKG